MKIIIAGSRTFTDYELLKGRMDYFLKNTNKADVEIVSGTAKGGDKLGERYAKEKGYKLSLYPADFETYGKGAGFRRNVAMAEYATHLVAFWAGSPGTQMMIEAASKKKFKNQSSSFINYTMLDISQQSFLTAVNSGENLFLAGKAGTGKSTITRTAMGDLKKKGKQVAALAPTGVAAQNIGGQTLHSFFGLPVGGVIGFKNCNHLSFDKRKIIDAVDVFVIDEISMVRADTFDAIMWTLKKNGCKRIDQYQWILIGDMKQLSPVADDNEKSVMSDFYMGVSFKHSELFEKLSFTEIELTTIHRQSDPKYIEALNTIREGGKHDYFRQFANKAPSGIVLAAHKDTVDKYNSEGLAAQPGKLYTFCAVLDGVAKLQDFNLPARVDVKDGCKIMYLINSKEDNRLVNGTIGIFREQEGRFFIEVNGLQHPLDMVIQEKKKYVLVQGKHPITGKRRDELELQVIGSITQYPIRLAYAITIHKAQGLSFSEVTVDLTRPMFSEGQMYVALSRCRTPEGLSLITKSR